MTDSKAHRRRRLDSAVAVLQQKHGPRAVFRGIAAAPPPPHLATGFAALDALTGCQGIPLGALTLLSGRSTSGKLTIAYKCLVSAQAQGAAALLDLTHTANPDYLQRCGVNLAQLLIARPQAPADAVPLLLDLVQSAHARLVLLDGLPSLGAVQGGLRALDKALPRLRLLIRAAGCAVLLLDEPAPPWQRWLGLDAAAVVRQQVALHVALRRERWLMAQGALTGYSARAALLASHYRPDRPTTSIAIHFNGAVRAGASW